MAVGLGYLVVYYSTGASRKPGKMESSQRKGIASDGVYTPATLFAVNSSGAGLPGYLGPDPYYPSSGGDLLTRVKDQTASIYSNKTSLFVDPTGSTPYAAIGNGVTNVVPYVRTFGAALPGSSVPGAGIEM